jgi:hypothetical protein
MLYVKSYSACPQPYFNASPNHIEKTLIINKIKRLAQCGLFPAVIGLEEETERKTRS